MDRACNKVWSSNEVTPADGNTGGMAWTERAIRCGQVMKSRRLTETQAAWHGPSVQ